MSSTYNSTYTVCFGVFIIPYEELRGDISQVFVGRDVETTHSPLIGARLRVISKRGGVYS